MRAKILIKSDDWTAGIEAIVEAKISDAGFENIGESMEYNDIQELLQWIGRLLERGLSLDIVNEALDVDIEETIIINAYLPSN